MKKLIVSIVCLVLVGCESEQQSYLLYCTRQIPDKADFAAGVKACSDAVKQMDETTKKK